jgi:hypothetical protein
MTAYIHITAELRSLCSSFLLLLSLFPFDLTLNIVAFELCRTLSSDHTRRRRRRVHAKSFVSLEQSIMLVIF